MASGVGEWGAGLGAWGPTERVSRSHWGLRTGCVLISPKVQGKRDLLRVSGPPRSREPDRTPHRLPPQNVNHGQSVFSPKRKWGAAPRCWWPSRPSLVGMGVGSGQPPRLSLRPHPVPLGPSSSRAPLGHCPQGIKKPYNPVLGETFRCRWFHPHTSSHTFYIAEQVRPGRSQAARRARGGHSDPSARSWRPPGRRRDPPGSCSWGQAPGQQKVLPREGTAHPDPPGALHRRGVSSASLGSGTESREWPGGMTWGRGRGLLVRKLGSVLPGEDCPLSSARRCPTTRPCPPSTSVTGRTASASAATSQPSPGFTVRGLPWAVPAGG